MHTVEYVVGHVRAYMVAYVALIRFDLRNVINTAAWDLIEERPRGKKDQGGLLPIVNERRIVTGEGTENDGSSAGIGHWAIAVEHVLSLGMPVDCQLVENANVLATPGSAR